MNDDPTFELVTFSDGVVDIPAGRAGDIEAAEMLLADGRALTSGDVVVWVGVHSGVIWGEISSHADPAIPVAHADNDKDSSKNLKRRIPEVPLLPIVRICLSLASVQLPPLPHFQTVFSTISNQASVVVW